MDNVEQTSIDTVVLNLSVLPQIGEVVNEKYQIVREIARGGMGVVYEAKNIVFNTKVALKMLQFQEANPIAMKRFEREFQVCSQLSHPNIIKMYDCGLYKKNPYIVMDYIEGIAITEYVAQHDPAYGTENKRDYKLCVKLIAQIAHALEYVHKHKICHRDIKPSNILVCEDGRPILIDFGIVKFQQEQTWSLTKTTEIVGTCGYMSPEQIDVNQNKLDHRSDIYSLGILLYELLTEQHAFYGNIMDVLNKITTVYPPLPSTIRKDIPKSLENIVMLAIEKDRDYRYQSAEEFANALEQYLANKQKYKNQYSKISAHLQKHSKQKKSFFNATIISCILCLFAGMLVLHIINKISNNSQNQLQQTKQENINLQDTTNFLQDEIENHNFQQKNKINPNNKKNFLHKIKRASATKPNLPQKEEKQNIDVSVSNEAEEQYQLGVKYNKGINVEQDLEKALEYYEKAANLNHTQAQYTLGTMYAKGYYVHKDIEKAFYWYEKAANQNHPESQYRLAGLYYMQQDYEKAYYWYGKVRLLYEKAAEKGDAEAQYNLAGMYQNGWGIKQDWAKARYWFEKSRLSYEKLAKQGDEDSLYSLGNLYYFGYGTKQDIHKAISYFEKITEKDDNQNYEKAIMFLGSIYYMGHGIKQNIEKAISCFEKAAEKNNRDAQNLLGEIYYRGEYIPKDLEKAFYWYEKAAEQDKRAKSIVGFMYANGYGVKKDIEKAISYFEQERELYEHTAKEGFADSQYILGFLYEHEKSAKNNLKEAIYWYEKAAEQNHPEALCALGILYLSGKNIMPNLEKAHYWLEKAANQDNAEAQSVLGSMYLNGRIKQNLEKAHYWIEKAANQDYAEAQNNLGVMYYRGQGVPKDLQKALYWVEKARLSFERKAEKEDKNAQYSLGFLYYNGQGLPKDLEKAFYWFEKAANQNHTQAQYMLSMMYQNGQGVQKDLKKAQYWLKMFQQNK